MFKQFWQDKDFQQLVAKTNGMLAELEAVCQDIEAMDYNDDDPGHHFEFRNEYGKYGNPDPPQYDSRKMQAALEYIMQESILLARAEYNSVFRENKAFLEEQDNG